MKILSEDGLWLKKLCKPIVLMVLVFFAVSTAGQPSYSQRRGKEPHRAAVAAMAQNPLPDSNRPPAVRLFDAEFKKEILRVSFIEKMTDEVEFTRIYKALADDMAKLREALCVAIDSAERNYAACLTMANTVHRREKAAAIEKIKRNRDPERVESLKSLLNSIELEHKNYYRAEAEKAKNAFKSLFDSFASSFAVQKKFLASNTVYESPDSEAMRAVDSFEAGIKQKCARIEKYISDKFEAAGADYGNK